MATTKTRKSDAKKQLSDYYLYVPLGAGQLLVEKTKTVSAKAFKLAKGGRKSAVRTYEDLAKRGENLAKRRNLPCLVILALSFLREGERRFPEKSGSTNAVIVRLRSRSVARAKRWWPCQFSNRATREPRVDVGTDDDSSPQFIWTHFQSKMKVPPSSENVLWSNELKPTRSTASALEEAAQ